MVKNFTDLLDQHQIASIVFDKAQPNPTVSNVNDGLETLGVKVDDLSLLADNALKDVCGLTNPKQASHEEICNIFRAAM